MKDIPCFISGKTPTQFYAFGDSVILPLSQEVFAKFILRAGENEGHQQIMSQLREQLGKIGALEEQVNPLLNRYEVGLEVTEPLDRLQLELAEQNLEFKRLLVDKARSGLDILDEIRKEYEG